MEFQTLALPLLLIALIHFLSMALILLHRSKVNNPMQKLPPTPWRLPLIGNMHQFGWRAHRNLRDLAKKHGPLMRMQLGQVSYTVVSSPEVAKEILRVHDTMFVDRFNLLGPRILGYGCTDIIFCRYGAYWRQLRRICMSKLLGVKKVQSFRSVREEEVSNLVKIISSSRGSPLNLSKMINSLTYTITARAAFSEKSKDQEAFISIISSLGAAITGFHFVDAFPFIEPISTLRRKFVKLHQQADQILGNIINDHRQTTNKTKAFGQENDDDEDIVDFLLKHQGNDVGLSLSEDNIKAVILDVFTAGSDTTSTTIEWVMAELMKNPTVMKRAQAEVREVFRGRGNVDEAGIQELKYLKLVIKETFRLHPPLAIMPRQCTESCKVNGYDIPEGTRILVNLWAIGRDPRHWTEADRFYPERFLNSSVDYKGMDFEFIPFGSGRRMCPGMFFGLASIELPIAQLLYHFDWELPVGMTPEDFDMTETIGSATRIKKELVLVPLAYQPQAEPKID